MVEHGVHRVRWQHPVAQWPELSALAQAKGHSASALVHTQRLRAEMCLRVCVVVVQINARRINDELNVFKDLHKSAIFIGVLVVTAGLQVGCNGAKLYVCTHACSCLCMTHAQWLCKFFLG
jgi:hypothetical protein